MPDVKLSHIIIGVLAILGIHAAVVLALGASQRSSDYDAVRAGRDCKGKAALDPVVHSGVTTKGPHSTSFVGFLSNAKSKPVFTEDIAICIAANLVEKETGKWPYFKTPDEAREPLDEELGKGTWDELRNLSNYSDEDVVENARDLARNGRDEIGLAVLGYLQWSPTDKAEGRSRAVDDDLARLAEDAVYALNDRWMPGRVFWKNSHYFLLAWIILAFINSKRPGT